MPQDIRLLITFQVRKNISQRDPLPEGLLFIDPPFGFPVSVSYQHIPQNSPHAGNISIVDDQHNEKKDPIF